jgi:hypothetical protein
MEFPSEKFSPKKDRFLKKRGGDAKFLYVVCADCDEPAMVYQKDGPGQTLRYYSDRIVWPPELVERQQEVDAESVKRVGALACLNCNNILGLPMVYKPENRAAYRAVPGSIHSYRSAQQAAARTEN